MSRLAPPPPPGRVRESSVVRVPLIRPDLPSFEEIEGEFREVLSNGRVTNFGKYVRQFEEEAGSYLGTNVVTTSSGTMGLILTLQALGVSGGQEVILPGFTFMATAQAVLYTGSTPVFAEVEDDLTLSPSDLELLLARHPAVSAVIPVHTYGLPCRIEEIQQVVADAAPRRGRQIAVVYDAAHGFGASQNGQRVGSFGNAEVFSLSVTKLLVSVEGGMVSSSDEQLITRLRKMRNYGIEANYDAEWPGLNSKMSEFHAIIGLHNLRRLPNLLAERQRKAAYYAQRIESETEFTPFTAPPGVVHTYKDFSVRVPVRWRAERDRIIALLAEHGIETRAYFSPPVHEQGFFRRFADRSLPVTEDLSRRVITLPFYSTISEAEMDTVVAALKSVAACLS